MPQYGNLINAHTNKRNLAAGYGLLCGMLYNYNIIKFESSGNDFLGDIKGACPLRRMGCGEDRLRAEPRGKAFPLYYLKLVVNTALDEACETVIFWGDFLHFFCVVIE